MELMIVWGFVATFLASAITGLTGFGFALILVPALTLLLSPREVVPIIYLLGTISTILVLVETRRWIDPARIWLLALAGVVGAPLGTYLLVILDVGLLKAATGGLCVITALALLFDFRLTIRNERLAGLPVGFASGLLGGSTGLAGPPVIIFFSNQGKDKQTFRANLTLYYTILGFFMLISQGLNGLVTRDILRYCLWWTPALLLGATLGMKLAHRVSESHFRRLSLIVVMLSGLSATASGLGLI
jgi:uncharacterized protein